MNIAYLILAHQRPALLVRLVRRLDAPGTSILVHVDAKTEDEVYRAMSEPLVDRPNVCFLPRQPCYWGDFSLVRATLSGLLAALTFDPSVDYVVLLTGQHYPLRSNAEIAATLDGAEGGVFIHGIPLPNESWDDGGMYRIEHRHFRFGPRRLAFPGKPFRRARLDAAWSFAARVLRLYRTFPADLHPYGGSQFWMMPAACVRYVLAFVESRPDVVEFFRHVEVPDEIFFQTVVMNSPFRDRVTGNSLHYVDWEAAGDHPKILTSDDLDEMMQTGNLFARKFDPDVDSTVLDRVDRVLAGAR